MSRVEFLPGVQVIQKEWERTNGKVSTAYVALEPNWFTPYLEAAGEEKRLSHEEEKLLGQRVEEMHFVKRIEGEPSGSDPLGKIKEYLGGENFQALGAVLEGFGLGSLEEAIEPGRYEEIVGGVANKLGKEPQTAEEMVRDISIAQHLLEEIGEGDPPKILSQIKSAGEEARSRFIKANLLLVVRVAKGYRRKGHKLGDLVGEGNTGLIRAVDKYNWRLGYKFSTYANWWIRQVIWRAIQNSGRPIRVPVHLDEKIKSFWSFINGFMQTYGREPTAEEIGEEMGLGGEKVALLLKVTAPPASLDLPVGADGEKSPLADLISDPNALDPQEEAIKTDLREDIDKALASLTDRERKIIRLRHGFEDGENHTLMEVGKEFGVTRERIRQIEAKAMRKLRHPKRSRKLAQYL